MSALIEQNQQIMEERGTEAELKPAKELFPAKEHHHGDDEEEGYDDGDDEDEADDDDDDSEEEEEDGDDCEEEEDDYGDEASAQVQLCAVGGTGGGLPAVFQTSGLVFYERFKAYQDYMLGDCKPSEVKDFTADYLEKVVEPCGWHALWHTDLFDVLVEVVGVDYKDLRASVVLSAPLRCETRGRDLSGDSLRTLVEAVQNRVPLQELVVVLEDSGEMEQTALALEHLRFFYKHIWRAWDEEDEDDEFDYFVRCVEPRLRLYYDVLENRVPVGLVDEYHSLVKRCTSTFREFSGLRNLLSSDSESELDNVSMVEVLHMYQHMETLIRRLRIIENPLLRYVLGYRMNCGQQGSSSKGERAGGGRRVHVVSSSTTLQSLQNLIHHKLLPLYGGKEYLLQFHSEPTAAVTSCYEGDVVIVCPGHYCITEPISISDSILLEGYGLPDEIVIEKRNKGDTFMESIGTNVKVSNLKFIQHDAIEGILCVRQGRLEMENCVLQCENTGVIVRTSSELIMNMCDLYGSKGAGVEIYPGSVCSLVNNGIHHCKEGVLIKDFADELDVLPKITMVNNVIHNNAGYGVIMVKPDHHSGAAAAEPEADGDQPEARAVRSKVGNDSKSSEAPAEVLRGGLPLEFTAGNEVIKQELQAMLVRKRHAQRSRPRDGGSMQNDENLLSQEMFISIEGNQFRRNAMGSFGTFLY